MGKKSKKTKSQNKKQKKIDQKNRIRSQKIIRGESAIWDDILWKAFTPEETKPYFCLMCGKPKATEITYYCGECSHQIAQIKGMFTGKLRQSIKTKHFIWLKKYYSGISDVLAYLCDDPTRVFPLWNCRDDRNKMKKAALTEAKLLAQSTEEYNREDDPPLFIKRLFDRNPSYELIFVEGDRHDPYIRCRCVHCGYELGYTYSEFIESDEHYCPEKPASGSSGEFVVENFLQEKDIQYKTQRGTLRCINPDTGFPLPYDFELTDYKIIIEVQGDQHLHYTEYFHRTEENWLYQQKKDAFKRDFALSKGYGYLELSYKEISSGEYKNLIRKAMNVPGFVHLLERQTQKNNENKPLPKSRKTKNESSTDTVSNNTLSVNVGDKVFHNTLGQGTVSAMLEDSNRIHIKFEKSSRAFIYPDAFQQGYISLIAT